jgi:hypothetical protein
VGNSSTNATDPSGELAWFVIPAIVAVGGAILGAYQNYSYQSAQVADRKQAEIDPVNVVSSGAWGAVGATAGLTLATFVPQSIPFLAGAGLFSAAQNTQNAITATAANDHNTAEHYRQMAYLDLFSSLSTFHTPTPPSMQSATALATSGANALSGALVGSGVSDIFQHYFASSNQSGGAGNKDSRPGYTNSEGVPIPREEDVTDGPHGPYATMNAVVGRLFGKDKKGNPARGSGPQGRWLSEEAGREAVKNLDVEKMDPLTAYSVPIPKKTGVVVRQVKVYPERKLTIGEEKYIEDPANRAIVIIKSNGIHTYPIGPENPAYHVEAPIKK